MIRAEMHHHFDKPDLPLVIDPVSVESDFAVAGWTQGPTGGRALLRKRGSSWAIILCSGDQIRSADALESAGLPAKTAKLMALRIEKADASLDPARRAALASFQGGMHLHAPQ